MKQTADTSTTALIARGVEGPKLLLGVGVLCMIASIGAMIGTSTARTSIWPWGQLSS